MLTHLHKIKKWFLCDIRENFFFLLSSTGSNIFPFVGDGHHAHEHANEHGDEHHDEHGDEHADEHGDEHADEHADEHNHEEGDEHGHTDEEHEREHDHDHVELPPVVEQNVSDCWFFFLPIMNLQSNIDDFLEPYSDLLL